MLKGKGKKGMEKEGRKEEGEEVSWGQMFALSSRWLYWQEHCSSF